MAERRPGRVLPVSVVIGAIAVVAAAAIWFHRKDEVAVNGSVARCTAAQRAGHGAACHMLDTAPAVLVRGPIDASGTAAGSHRVVADATRRFSVRLGKGTYDVFVLIGTVAIEPAGGPDRAVRHVGDAGLAGLRIAPGPAWQVAGSVAS